MLGQMRLQMQRARWLNQIMPERQKSAVEEHTQIISALLGKDLDQSICAIRQHLTNSEHAFETVYHSGHMRQISKMLSSAFAEQSPQASYGFPFAAASCTSSTCPVLLFYVFRRHLYGLYIFSVKHPVFRP